MGPPAVEAIRGRVEVGSLARPRRRKGWRDGARWPCVEIAPFEAPRPSRRRAPRGAATDRRAACADRVPPLRLRGS